MDEIIFSSAAPPEGLPIGVQVVARPWREDEALAVAQLIEKVLGDDNVLHSELSVAKEKANTGLW